MYFVSLPRCRYTVVGLFIKGLKLRFLSDIYDSSRLFILRLIMGQIEAVIGNIKYNGLTLYLVLFKMANI